MATTAHLQNTEHASVEREHLSGSARRVAGVHSTDINVCEAAKRS